MISQSVRGLAKRSCALNDLARPDAKPGSLLRGLLQVKAIDRQYHHAIIAPVAKAFWAIKHRGQVMANKREPMIKPIPILSLRPTQMTVGYREVKQKRMRWREEKSKKQSELLGKHMIPVVYGPDERYYVVDHHHLARALHEEGVKDILVTVIGDLRMVERDAFWGVMDNKRWVYPYDAKGERRHFKDIPKKIADLKDDPFRSLAGELRRAGGFAKDTTPFSEFLWADFLRRKMSSKSVNENFSKAMEKSLALAKSKDAIYLPGWCGPASDD
jgi:hypothetical protein